MLDYLVYIAICCPLPLVIAGYLFMRRALPRSRGLLLFDIMAVLLGLLLPAAFFWREITGHISEDVWLEERQMIGLLVPVWFAIIGVPFFMVAAALRFRFFSKPDVESTHMA
jgi:membrane protein YqaA with SNARE-associated domain